MRLGDLDALRKQFDDIPVFIGMTGGCVQQFIDKQPIIDAVPVVRCKACKHWEKKGFQGGNDVNHLEYGGHCPYSYGARFESDYCSYGDRKGG